MLVIEVENAAKGVKQLHDLLVARGKRAMHAPASVLFGKTRQQVSQTQYTLAELRAKGHPYAVKHGSIQHAGFSQDPRMHVHARKGRLRRALRSKTTKDGAEVMFDTAASPIVSWVIEGTVKMIARDPLWGAAMGTVTQKRMVESIRLEMAREVALLGGTNGVS